MVLISGILPVLISGFQSVIKYWNSYYLIDTFYLDEFIGLSNKKSHFFDPGSDPLGTGWNIIQSQIAVGSGSLFGKGFTRNSKPIKFCT